VNPDTVAGFATTPGTYRGAALIAGRCDAGDGAPGRPATLAALLLAASITNSLVTLATHIIGDLGLAGVFLLTMSSGVIGVPGTEPTMLFAGFNVFEGHLTLVGIIAFGVAGDLVGASIAYGIGYFGRVELLERHGRKLHVSPARLQLANNWFARYGSPVILISRLLPFVRAVFPYAAGVAEMPYWRFLLFAAIGSVIWIGGLGALGQAVGSNWESWRHNLEYADYAILILVVAAIVFLVVRRIRGRQSAAAEPPPASVSDRL
jgi:membrane protein DedA with SNARE-associated domain